MSFKEVKVGFQQEKYDVLAYFLKKEGQEIEPLMKDYLDKIYQKAVPKQTRDYIGFKIGEEQPGGQEQEMEEPDQQTAQEPGDAAQVAQAAEPGDESSVSEASTGRSARRPRRNAAAQVAETGAEVPVQENAEQQSEEPSEPQMAM